MFSHEVRFYEEQVRFYEEQVLLQWAKDNITREAHQVQSGTVWWSLPSPKDIVTEETKWIKLPKKISLFDKFKKLFSFSEWLMEHHYSIRSYFRKKLEAVVFVIHQTGNVNEDSVILTDQLLVLMKYIAFVVKERVFVVDREFLDPTNISNSITELNSRSPVFYEGDVFDDDEVDPSEWARQKIKDIGNSYPEFSEKQLWSLLWRFYRVAFGIDLYVVGKDRRGSMLKFVSEQSQFLFYLTFAIDALPSWLSQQIHLHRQKDPTLVYFIGDREFVKIGHVRSSNLNKVYKRMADLQVGNPMKLELIYVQYGGLPVEKMLHEKFSHLLTPSKNEWRIHNQEIDEYIYSVEQSDLRF